MDGAVWTVREDLYLNSSDSQAGWADQDEACRVGGFGVYASLAHERMLLDLDLVPWKERQDVAYWSWQGLGDERADRGGEEGVLSVWSRVKEVVMVLTLWAYARLQ